MSQQTQQQWTGRTDGASWMHKALVALLRVTPLPLAYLIMALVVPFYLAFNRSGTRAIYRYLRYRQGWSAIHAGLGCYGNHFLFGTVILDRFAAYAGRRFHTHFPGRPLFNSLAERPEGVVMLSAHIGSPELCGYMLASDRKRMNAVVFPGEKATLHGWRKQMLTRNNIRMIAADGGMDWLFTLNAALSNGEIINIHADRTFGSPKTLRVRIMGAEADIPQGPFSLAAMHEKPMVAAFCLKTGLKRYEVPLFRLDTPEMSQMNRQEHMQALADAYAAVVEQVLRKWPLQWFNFYAFWN